jgi:uncharacterized protein RhaS with RHS repeats
MLLGHRYYDASIGRFLTRDSAKDGRNWYAYVSSNPLRASDPTGFGLNFGELDSVHGNTAGSQLAYLYALFSNTDGFLKWGVSQDPWSRYTQTFLDDKRIEIVTTGERINILKIERTLSETDPGPLNREPWAGKRAGLSFTDLDEESQVLIDNNNATHAFRENEQEDEFGSSYSGGAVDKTKDSEVVGGGNASGAGGGGPGPMADREGDD